MLTDAYLDNFFKGIELKGKSLLDVGCGDGSLMRYACNKEAFFVDGIDPEYDSEYSCRIRFQNYRNIRTFDIIVLHDSLNHLDEEACINLKNERPIYILIAQKLRSLMVKGGLLVIADASPRNLWHDFHIVNPFDYSIEWHKHQTPQTWIKLFSECGFGNPRVSWLTPARLLKYDWLIRHRFVSYCLVSHFRLVMEAV